MFCLEGLSKLTLLLMVAYLSTDIYAFGGSDEQSSSGSTDDIITTRISSIRDLALIMWVAGMLHEFGELADHHFKVFEHFEVCSLPASCPRQFYASNLLSFITRRFGTILTFAALFSCWAGW